MLQGWWSRQALSIHPLRAAGCAGPHRPYEVGVKNYATNVILVDDWADHGPTSRTATITLEAGRKYDITLEYFDDLAGATVRLAWKRPGQSAFAIIPQSNLYSS